MIWNKLWLKKLKYIDVNNETNSAPHFVAQTSETSENTCITMRNERLIFALINQFESYS